jgi:non-lysosomal glucosylceramidase
MIKFSNNTRPFDASHTAVAFPLGGIGTGNVSLGARGDLRDWEIFNTPAKGNILPNTFFAIRTQIAEQPPVARVLEGPVQPPHNLSHGYHPATNAGLPRCAQSRFRGEYPVAQINFEDPNLPVAVQLEAFTPLVPLSPEDSGIPCAILTYTVTNTSPEKVAMTLAGSLINPIGGLRLDPFMNIGGNITGKPRNEFRTEDNLRGLFLTSEEIDPNDLHYGNMSLVTDHPNITVKPAWLRGEWWDFLQDFWDDFVDDGLLDDLKYQTPSRNRKPDTGSLGLVATLAPGEQQSFRFVLTWYFPNRQNTWMTTNMENFVFDHDSAPDAKNTKIIRNHYATRFADAWDVATYVNRESNRLEADTHKFHDALFGSTLPPQVLDAISANIVPVRSNTCFWLEGGRFYGWEGCFDDAGCCAGSCTHVWSYAYTVAFLFPSLEREMRRIEFEVETEATGFMNFRNYKSMDELFVWSSADQQAPAAVDGQMGSILRAYREWLLSGDRDWLTTIWPGIKRAIDYASTQWDTDQDGVLDGKQHNTYDIEFYGPNPLSTVYYLAALRAVEQLARVMDEEALADRYCAVFEMGSQRMDQLLWNGSYYIQKIDDINTYKYQHGEGCLSDQLLGQLHAQLLGLGDLLPREHIRQTVKTIYDHNFRTSFSDHTNCQRTYVLNDESGLLMCTWPQGGRPKLPFTYSDEVWPGVEYQVAAHLITEGWVTEGLQMVQAVRDRHDGTRRNPWDEVECGHHYARSMSSWGLLLTLSGFRCDVNQNTMAFAPVATTSTDPDKFSTLWSNGVAWGVYTEHKDIASNTWKHDIEVLGGDLSGIQVTVHGKPL